MCGDLELEDIQDCWVDLVFVTRYAIRACDPQRVLFRPPRAYKTGALGAGSLRLIEGTISRQSLRKKARAKSS